MPSLLGGTIQETTRPRQMYTPIDLLASAARTASGAGADVQSPFLAAARSLLLVCEVTAKAGTAPALDVAIQAKMGSNYYTLAEFSLFADALGVKMIVINGDASFATEVVLAADPVVVSGFAKKDAPWGDTFRAKYTIGGSAGQSMTFKVTANPFN